MSELESEFNELDRSGYLKSKSILEKKSSRTFELTKFQILSIVFMGVIFLVSVSALVLGVLNYTKANEEINVNTLSVQEIQSVPVQNLNPAIAVKSAMQFVGKDSTTIPFVFGTTRFDKNVSIVGNAEIAGNLVNTTQVTTNSLKVLSEYNPVLCLAIGNQVASNSTDTIDIFTGATTASAVNSAPNNPNGGVPLPKNIGQTSCVVVNVSGYIPTGASSSAKVLALQLGTAGQTLIAVQTNATGPLFFSVEFRLSQPSLDAPIFGAAIVSSSNGTTGSATTENLIAQTSLNPWTAGMKLNVFISPTTSSGDIQIFASRVTYLYTS